MVDKFNLDSGIGVSADEDLEGAVFDLSTVPEKTGFDVIPRNTYNAVVDSFEFGPSSKGNPMVTIVYEITTGEFENRKVWDYWVLSGDGAEFGLAKLKQFLVRVAPDLDASKFNPKVAENDGVMIGRECQIKVAIVTQKKGDYKGEKRNQIREVLSASSANSFLG